MVITIAVVGLAVVVMLVVFLIGVCAGISFQKSRFKEDSKYKQAVIAEHNLKISRLREIQREMDDFRSKGRMLN